MFQQLILYIYCSMNQWYIEEGTKMEKDLMNVDNITMWVSYLLSGPETTCQRPYAKRG